MSPSPAVSAPTVLDIRGILTEMLGQERFDACLERVPEPLRREYLELVPVAWIDITKLETIYQVFADELRMPMPELQEVVVKKGVEKTFNGMWKVLLRFTTDDALVKRTPIFYSKTFNRGKLASFIPEPGLALLELTDWPDVSDFALRGLRGGVEGVLRAAGRKNIRGTTQRTDDGAKITQRWDK